MRVSSYLSRSFLCLTMGTLCAVPALAGPQPRHMDVVKPPIVKPLPSQSRDAHYIQVALLLDTSNSMDGLINQAKSQLWTLVNELSEGRRDGHAPHLELALYEYGNDGLSISKGYIRQVLPLTTDLDSVSEALFALSTDGGSEFAGQVIDTAITDLEWSKFDQDLKLVIIAGNERFTQGPVSYQSACERARENGIIIDTIHCGDAQQGISGKWKAGAECGGGIYMTIDQDAKSVHIDSPYDDEILRLNTALNKTYIGYGAQGEAMAERQAVQDSNASGYSKKSAIARVKSKASKLYKNESWDVVDAYEAAPEKILKLDDAELPAEMQGMDGDARKAFIEAKTQERETARAEIKALEAKREAYVAKERKAMSESETLDNVMVKAVRKQAEDKGYSFETNN